MFLREYCIGTSRIQLIDAADGSTVWKIRAKKDTPFCRFALHTGDNPVRAGLPADLPFAVIHPSTPTFRIRDGAAYELPVGQQRLRALERNAQAHPLLTKVR